jgi:hypothetical protein
MAQTGAGKKKKKLKLVMVKCGVLFEVRTGFLNSDELRYIGH